MSLRIYVSLVVAFVIFIVIPIYITLESNEKNSPISVIEKNEINCRIDSTHKSFK